MGNSVAVCLLRAADVTGRAVRCFELQFVTVCAQIVRSSIAAAVAAAAAVREDKL
jgi:hypothetical protein